MRLTCARAKSGWRGARSGPMRTHSAVLASAEAEGVAAEEEGEEEVAAAGAVGVSS